MTYKLHTTSWRPSTPQYFHDIPWSQVFCNGPAFTCGHNSPITAGFPPAKTASTNTWTSPMSPADVKSSRLLPKTHAAVLSKERECSDWTHLGIWSKRTKFKYSLTCYFLWFTFSFPEKTISMKTPKRLPCKFLFKSPFSCQYCWGYSTVHSAPWSLPVGSQTILVTAHSCHMSSTTNPAD